MWAQAGPNADLPVGRIIEKVSVAGRTEQSYALYLPSRYSAGERWPIVYAFDPMARGAAPVERMKAAAEQYGYIVAGSNNSKNGPVQPNGEAAQAMWKDTHAKLSIDDRRIYFAGFSGGARVAASLAQNCKCAAGVFLSGAGFGLNQPPTRDVVFPVFLTAGLTDFNYGELVELDAKLRELGFAHFLQRFDGPHDWAPAEVWPEAFAWADLGAMKSGTLPKDQAFVAAELKNFADRAKGTADKGEIYFAAQVYDESAASFEGLAATDALMERRAALERDAKYAAQRKREKEEIQEQSTVQREIERSMADLATAGPDHYAAERTAFDAARDLRSHAQKEKDAAERRVLERARMGIFVGLIEAASPLLDGKDLDLARIYLQLATEARPEAARAHVMLASCFMKLGKRREAVQALRKAKEAGLSAEELARLPAEQAEFAGLAEDSAFRKLLGSTPHR